ncbi:MAG TPA: tetratricopeptide repeat protein [Bryobacteraceae bacterium]|jgi:hypothetical protein|nr:tetratricopeptide repeat protein [Bryobacteraceae bacterium]
MASDPHLPRRVREIRLQELEGQIGCDRAGVNLRFERACLLAENGRTTEARNAYIDVLSRDPSHRAALNNLGMLLQASGYRTAARTAFAEAVQRYPADPASRVNLANALRESGDSSRAREHYEAALELQPDFAEAHQGLAAIFSDEGDFAGAARHREMGFGGRPVMVVPYRGAGLAVTVLVLSGTSGGNAPIRHFLSDQIFQTSILFVEYHGKNLALPEHCVVFNAIGDAEMEGPALEAALGVLRLTTAPVINLPGAVALTGRSENAQRLADIPGVITAGGAKLSRAVLAGAADALAGLGLEFPLLVRTPGFHTGRYFVRVEKAGDLAGALAELPGDELVVMRYLDARGPDGKVRKYRVMMIDGELYPLHAAISSDWKIHYFTAEMAESAAHRAEDAAFLENMAGVVGPLAMSALREIQRRLGLDYAGIDFGLNSKGEILFFEANATMVVNAPEPGEKWDYRRPAVERIFSAVRNMVIGRAG